MIDYTKFPRHKILCVDMKSFYASISAVMMGVDHLECYFAVVGNTKELEYQTSMCMNTMQKGATRRGKPLQRRKSRLQNHPSHISRSQSSRHL
ncbi:lesion bypass phage DNA polymerase, partial [Bacillus xiamenensis]